ncbi:MAG: PEGA domain-containing protein [Planctomycetota bacterium]
MPKTRRVQSLALTMTMLVFPACFMSGCEAIQQGMDAIKNTTEGVLWQKEEVRVVSGHDPRAYQKIALVSSSDVPLDGDEGLSEDVEAIVTNQLIDYGYQPINRSSVEAALDEIEIGDSGLTDGQAVQIGNFVQVPGIVVAKITGVRTIQERSRTSTTSDIKSEVTVTLKLINVETLAVEWNGRNRGTVSGRDAYSEAVEKATEDLARSIPTLLPRITIESSPSDASIFVDNAREGTTRSTIQLDSLDPVEIRVERTGFTSETKTIEPEDGKTYTFQLTSELDMTGTPSESESEAAEPAPEPSENPAS